MEGEASASAVARALGLSRSATYRIIETLKEKGFLEVDPASKKLRPGIKSIELGVGAISEVDAFRLSPPYLRDLAEATLETVFLAVMDAGSMVYIFQEEGPRAVKMSSKLGSRRPLHCTALGKAFMSALPDEDRRSLVESLDLREFTANTITDAGALLAELEQTKARGYAVDNAEIEEGVRCLGAPILDYKRLPVAAISVTGLAERVMRKEEEMSRLLVDATSEISRRLGYVDLRQT